MNDLKELLQLALPDGQRPGPARPADPACDLARGRRLLRRQRLARLTGGAAVAAAAVLVPLAVHAAGSAPAAHPGAATGGPRPATARSAPGPAAAQPASGLALVAYEGQQPPGYRVAEVPQGWVIQGGNAIALVLAPKGDKNTRIDVYEGKLVVMLQSRDAGPPTQGSPQPVAGRPGRFDVQGDMQILTYQDAAGQWVVIQAPTFLGWDSARLAQFAAGVQVLGNAQQGRG